MDTLITLEEKRKIQLDMLEEIHEVCIKNNIRYSLSCGTLLGAIRHKGFIPWDDDVDIMMPLPDMIKLKELLKSPTIMFADIDTYPHFEYGFSRIIHKGTYSKMGLFSKTYGINIDLYPVTALCCTKKEQEKYFKRGEVLLNKRLKFMRMRHRLKLLLPMTTIPIFDTYFDRSIRRYRDFMFKENPEYGTCDYYHVWSGGVSNPNIHIYKTDLFEKIITAPFEDRYFMIISKYDEYLTHTYGIYMQLPPENERVAYHSGHYFWK